MKYFVYIFFIILIFLLISKKKIKNSDNFYNKMFKVKDLCKKYKNKEVDLYILGGNKGDGLIYEGLYNYFEDYNIKYNSNINKKSNNTLFITGSGGYSPSYNSAIDNLNIINLYDDIWIFPSTFDTSVKKVQNFLSSLNKDKVKIFCRENKSFNDIKKNFKGEVYLDNDTAFNINYDKWKKQGKGVLYALRLDKEKNEKVLNLFKDKKINDVSKGNYTEWEELLKDISEYNEIHTNRAHVSIAATLLGKKTFVYPSNYFKQLEIYKYSLSQYPNCKFVY